MLVDMMLSPTDTCSVTTKDGAVIVRVPLEAIKRAYCDSVAREVEKRAAARSLESVQ